MSKEFIDKYAQFGRPKLAPDAEMTVSTQPQSRSLIELSKFDAESRRIECEIKRGKLRLNLEHVIGDKIVIKKVDALKLANWILKTYKTKIR